MDGVEVRAGQVLLQAPAQALLAVEALPGQAHGDDGQRLHRRPARRQVLDGAPQVGAVVPAGGQHHLGVQLDPPGRQEVDLLPDIRRGGVPQQPAAHLRLGGMHGDVEGGEVLLADLLPVRGGEVGQGDEVRRQERVAEVVVLDIERAAHPGGGLIDEAEDAAVVADPDSVRGGLGELQPQPFRTDVHAFLAGLPCRGLPAHLDGVRRRVEVDVDHVTYGVAVDRDERVSGAEADLLGDAPWGDALDGEHGKASLSGGHPLPPVCSPGGRHSHGVPGLRRLIGGRHSLRRRRSSFALSGAAPVPPLPPRAPAFTASPDESSLFLGGRSSRPGLRRLRGYAPAASHCGGLRPGAGVRGRWAPARRPPRMRKGCHSGMT